MSFVLLTPSTTMFMMYTAYTVTGGVLTNEIVFTPRSFVFQLSATSVFSFLRAIMNLAEGTVAVSRIQVCGRLTYSLLPVARPLVSRVCGT